MMPMTAAELEETLPALLEKILGVRLSGPGQSVTIGIGTGCNGELETQNGFCVLQTLDIASQNLTISKPVSTPAEYNDPAYAFVDLPVLKHLITSIYSPFDISTDPVIESEDDLIAYETSILAKYATNNRTTVMLFVSYTTKNETLHALCVDFRKSRIFSCGDVFEFGDSKLLDAIKGRKQLNYRVVDYARQIMIREGKKTVSKTRRQAKKRQKQNKTAKAE